MSVHKHGGTNPVLLRGELLWSLLEDSHMPGSCLKMSQRHVWSVDLAFHWHSGRWPSLLPIYKGGGQCLVVTLMQPVSEQFYKDDNEDEGPGSSSEDGARGDKLKVS